IALHERRRTLPYASDACVTVLHRPGKLAPLVRCPHALVFRRRHSPREHGELRTSAHAAVERFDEHLGVPRFGEHFRTHFALLAPDDPECLRLSHLERCSTITARESTIYRGFRHADDLRGECRVDGHVARPFRPKTAGTGL